jgi:hypothetical protein
MGETPQISKELVLQAKWSFQLCWRGWKKGTSTPETRSMDAVLSDLILLQPSQA